MRHARNSIIPAGQLKGQRHWSQSTQNSNYNLALNKNKTKSQDNQKTAKITHKEHGEQKNIEPTHEKFQETASSNKTNTIKINNIPAIKQTELKSTTYQQ